MEGAIPPTCTWEQSLTCASHTPPHSGHARVTRSLVCSSTSTGLMKPRVLAPVLPGTVSEGCSLPLLAVPAHPCMCTLDRRMLGTPLGPPAPGPTPEAGVYQAPPAAELQLLALPQGWSARGAGSLGTVRVLCPPLHSGSHSTCKSRTCSGLLTGVGQASFSLGSTWVSLQRALGPRRAGPGHPAPPRASGMCSQADS